MLAYMSYQDVQQSSMEECKESVQSRQEGGLLARIRKFRLLLVVGQDLHSWLMSRADRQDLGQTEEFVQKQIIIMCHRYVNTHTSIAHKSHTCRSQQIM